MMRASRLLFSAIVMSCLVIAAHAQTYPSQPVRVITPYQAGGGLDMMCRGSVALATDERDFGRDECHFLKLDGFALPMHKTARQKTA